MARHLPVLLVLLLIPGCAFLLSAGGAGIGAGVGSIFGPAGAVIGAVLGFVAGYEGANFLEPGGGRGLDPAAALADPLNLNEFADTIVRYIWIVVAVSAMLWVWRRKKAGLPVIPEKLWSKKNGG